MNYLKKGVHELGIIVGGKIHPPTHNEVALCCCRYGSVKVLT